MRGRAVVLAIAVVAGCRGGGSGGSGAGSGTGAAQTTRAAMEILCGRGDQPPDVSTMTPADRERELGNWLDREIRDPAARAMIATLADGRDRAARVRRAAADAGIPDCKPLALFGSRTVGGADVPDVAAAVAGTVELEQDLPVVVVTAAAVVVDGTQVVAVRAGAIAAADVPVLERYLATFAAQAAEPFTAADVAVDRSLTAPVLAAVLAAVARAGASRIDLAVGIGTDQTRAVPVAFTGPAASAGDPPGSLGVTARVGPAELVLYARSGAEGTLAAPRLRAPLAPPATLRTSLQGALGEIVDRRWHGTARAEADLGITVELDGAAPMQAIAEVVAAARAAPDGTPLFPSVRLR